MRKLKVAYPAWSTDKYNWDRVAAALKPLSKVCDLEVFYYGALPDSGDWCSFTKIAPPTNPLNIYDTAHDAVQIVAALSEFDVLYCWSGGAHLQLLCCLIGQVAGKPVVMHVNGDAHLSRRHHLRPMDRVMQDAIDRVTLNDVDLLVPISSMLQQAIQQRVKHHRVSAPVPFCVDTEHFVSLPFPEELCVGYAGRVSPEKGFPFFTKVMEASPKLKFRLAGVIQMAMKFPENAHYMGCLSLRDMLGFYRLSSVVALPSYGEGVPGVVLEAYACGRPVICTPQSLPAELPCFGWTAPHDTAEWTKILSGITQAEVEEKGAAARKWLTENWLSWDSYAETMKTKFEGVTNQ